MQHLNFMEILAIMVFGWPSAILGIVLLACGIIYKKARVSAAGAIIATGFCAYISLYPTLIRWIAVAAFAGNWASVFALTRRSVLWATASILPFVVLIIFMAYAVLTQ